MIQALIPICGWLMVIPWCVSLSGCRGWLHRYSRTMPNEHSGQANTPLEWTILAGPKHFPCSFMSKNLTLSKQPRPRGPTDSHLSPKSVRLWGYPINETHHSWLASPQKEAYKHKSANCGSGVHFRFCVESLWYLMLHYYPHTIPGQPIIMESPSADQLATYGDMSMKQTDLL